MSVNFEPFKKIDTVVLDCDGVLTDSQMLITESGELLRSMTVRDGYAIKKAILEGFRFCIITGGSSRGVEIRLKSLGIQHYFDGVSNKQEVFEKWADFHQLDRSRILYMGDDMPDLRVMQLVGLPVCPADAVPQVIQACKYVSPVNGGKGCVRDVLEKVLRLQGKW